MGKGTSYNYKPVLSQCTMRERLHCNSPVVGNVSGLRVCLFFLLCPHEVGLECSCNGLFKIDGLWIIGTVVENCRNFPFHCLHKAEPASQELIDVALLIPEMKEDYFYKECSSYSKKAFAQGV